MPTYKITGPDGRQFKVTGPNKDGALAALQAQLANKAPEAGDTSMSTAFKVGDASTIAATKGYIADANRQMEQGPIGSLMQAGEDYIAQPIAKALGVERGPRAAAVAEEQAKLDSAAAMAANRRDAVVKDSNYQSMTTADVDGVGSLLKFGGQKIAESAPAMAASIATGGSITPLLASGEINENLRDIEGLSEEDRIRLATGGGAISAVVENLGIGYLFKGVPKEMLGKMGVEGVSEVLEKNGLGRLTKRVAAGVATEGLTEAAQEGVSIGAEAIGGREFTADQVKDRLFEAGAAGSAAGGGIRGGTSIAGGVVDAVTPSAPKVRPDSPESRADASFAQRVQGIADANDLDLRDVNTGSTTGAREAVDKAHVQIAEDLKQVFADLKGLVKPGDLDALELVKDKVLAQAAYREGRNKTKNTVGKQELDALERLTGDTAEGQRALNLLGEMNVLTTIHNDGYKGGLSQYTDVANPFDGASNSYNSAAQISSKVLGPLATATAAYSTGGASLGAQAGVTAVGRGIDKMTGRRSRVERFVKQNKEGQGQLLDPNLPSLRQGRIDEANRAAQEEQDVAAQAAKRAEALKQLNLDLVKKGAPATEGSPQATVEAATGLDRSGVARILRIIEATNDNKLLQEAIKGYRGSVAVGGRVADMSPLIRAVNQMVESQPGLQDLRVREPVTGPAQGAQSSIQTSPENYQRGIDDNREMLQGLVEGAKADPTMSAVDKAQILTALDNLKRDLGADKGAKINEIMSKLQGVEPDAVAQFVEPYVSRVMGQQGPVDRNSAPRPEFGGKTDVSLDTSLANSFDTAKGEVFQKGRDFKLVLQEKSLEAQKREGIDLTTLDDANIDRLADFVVEDALEALKDNANAIGWYDRTITKALETVADLHPEVLTDPKAKLQLIWAVAVASNGLKVDKNFEIALDAYQVLKDTGRFPTDIGIGQAASAINGGLVQYHTMLDQFGGDHAALEQFMNSKVPVKQLEKEYGVQISGEGKNTLVRGASILGPKIGNGFFSNLYGNFDELTMDRWLMRTVGRWRGSLVYINKPMVAKKTSEIQDMLSSVDLKPMKSLFAGSDIRPSKNMSKAKVGILSAEIAKLSMDPNWRKAINGIPGGENLRKAGNGLAKYLDGQVEAPAGAKERTFIREVFQKGLKRLQDNPMIRQGSNTELTMSDLQALLWYPEKRLYDTAKQKDGGESRGYEDDEAPDYANAARKAVGDRLGSTGGTGAAGGGPIGPDAGPARQSIPGPGGILTQGANSPDNPVRSRTPEVTEVKAQIPIVRAAIEIGKPGSKFENGIKDMSGVEQLAAAYDIALKFYNSNADMLEDAPTADSGALGAYSPRQRTARVVYTGDIQELITALHETMHGVGVNSTSTGNFLGETKTTNGMTGRPDIMGVSSLESVMDFVLGKDKSDPLRREIVGELKHIQTRAQFSTGGVQAPIRGARPLATMLRSVKKELEANGISWEKNKALARKTMKDHQDYERSIGELTVDALQLYAHDPKTMKRAAPNSAKLIRDLFRKSGNKKIQFYSHPLAMVVAAVMAIMAKAGMEDEEEDQGALMPTPGVLSA